MTNLILKILTGSPHEMAEQRKSIGWVGQNVAVRRSATPAAGTRAAGGGGATQPKALSSIPQCQACGKLVEYATMYNVCAGCGA
jgi:hypothetical protein